MSKTYLKIIIIIFIVLLILFINTDSSQNIRIRVISNSDSDYDKMIKYECVEAIKSIIEANYSEKQIKESLTGIKSKLDIISNKYNKNIKLSFEKTKFPPKSLNEKIIEGGVYKTLLVRIGEAKGSNYWTLLYPEYFDISFDDIYSGEVEIKSFFYEQIKKRWQLILSLFYAIHII